MCDLERRVHRHAFGQIRATAVEDVVRQMCHCYRQTLSDVRIILCQHRLRTFDLFLERLDGAGIGQVKVCAPLGEATEDIERGKRRRNGRF